MFRRISWLRALILNPTGSGDIGGGGLGGGNLKLGKHLEWRDRDLRINLRNGLL